MHIPECSFLAVQNLSFRFIFFSVDSENKSVSEYELMYKSCFLFWYSSYLWFLTSRQKKSEMNFFLYSNVTLELGRAHAVNKITLMFTLIWVKRDFPINVEKFNSYFSSGEENLSWYPAPILWFDRLGKFVILSVSGDQPGPLCSRWGSWLVLNWDPHQ